MTKIAIIEDNPTISQMYRMKFEAEGFDVRMADNGRVGVEVVKTFQPDIILLDIQMPEMDGVEALQKIRELENGKDLPVVILTNLGEEEAPPEMRTLGIHSYIVKANFTPRQVAAHIYDIVQDMAKSKNKSEK